jgi:hypothetical protein
MSEEIERERIEWVYGLTGGELADTPWRGFAGDESHERDVEPVAITRAYWYEGIPDYCERSERERWTYDTRAVTLITWGGGYLPYPKKWIADESGIWVKVACYTNSGETECPGRHEDEGPKVRPEQCGEDGWCLLCEEREEHGYIYLGEGYEAIYALAVHRCEDCSEDIHCSNVDAYASRDCGCPAVCAACLDAAHEEAREDDEIREEEKS